MITLSVNNLKKSYGVDTIIENITFAINENENVGIVGPNGAGKTTLFKLISGELEKDEGQIFWGKGVDFGYLEQNVNIQSETTLLDEVLSTFADVIAIEKDLRRLEKEIALFHDSDRIDQIMDEYAKKSEYFTQINGYAYLSEARGILLGLGFTEEDFDKKINLLSGGEQTRLMLSKLLLKKPSVLLLDEPTNHLDTGAVEWLENYINLHKGNVIIISHDRYFLDKTTDTIMEIKDKGLTVFKGNYTDYTVKRDQILAQKEKQYKENQEEIQRQKDIITQLKAFGREKQVKRARSREKLLGKMDIVDKPTSIQGKPSIRFVPKIVSGYEVLKANDLSKSFDDKLLFKDMDLEIFRGDKVALIGPNGVGKTTLFNILLDRDQDFTGHVKYGTNVNPDYFDQTRSDLNPSNTVLDEVWNEYKTLTQTEVRNYLAAFLFMGEDVFKQISSLSGGEKARISLLKLMLSNSNFLFMDEPTNHLDIDSKEVLEGALNLYEGTLFFISHDRYFINAIADKIIAFTPGKIREFLGNYDDYQDTLQREKEEAQKKLDAQKVAVNKTQQKLQFKKEKDRSNDLRKLKRSIVDIEKEIEESELRLEEIDEELCKEDVYSSPELSLQFASEKKIVQDKLDHLLSDWESLHSQLDEFET